MIGSKPLSYVISKLNFLYHSNNCLAKSRHNVSLPRCGPLHHTNLNREVIPDGKAPLKM